QYKNDLCLIFFGCPLETVKQSVDDIENRCAKPFRALRGPADLWKRAVRRIFERHFERHRETAEIFAHMIDADRHVRLSLARNRIAMLRLEVGIDLLPAPLEIGQQAVAGRIPARDTVRAGDEIIGKRLIAMNIETEIDAALAHLRPHMIDLRAALRV